MFYSLRPGEWQKIGYLAREPTLKVIPSLPWHDGNILHMLFPTPDGLVDIPGGMIKGDYFAKAPTRVHDISLGFTNLFYKRAFDHRVNTMVARLTQDVHNLAASLRMIDYCGFSEELIPGENSQLAVIPVEYLIGLSRSFFDILQNIVGFLVRKLNPSKVQLLPESFADVALQGEAPRDANAMVKQWKLPIRVAEYYARHATFFRVMRAMRNSFEHDGVTPGPLLLDGDELFVSQIDQTFVEILKLFECSRLRQMSSLGGIADFIVGKTLWALEDFARVVGTEFSLPDDMAPGYRVFLSGYHSEYLACLRTPWKAPAA